MNNDQSGLGPSLIRTYTPVIVGMILAFLSREFGFVVDEDTASATTLVLGGFFTGLYYTVVRLLEKKFPQLGWLIGLAKQPAYSPAPPPEPEPVVVPAELVEDAGVLTANINEGVHQLAEDALNKKIGMRVALERIREVTAA